MTAATAEVQEEQRPVAVRDGSRWLHMKPTAEQVVEWFEEQPLHPGMEDLRRRYLGGIVVIPSTEKIRLTKLKNNGDPFVIEAEQAVYTPYVKVDTRIAYFHDYVREVFNEGDVRGPYMGVMVPVAQPIISDTSNGFYNANLPKGLAIHAVREGADKISKYLLSSWRAAIIERASYADLLRDQIVPTFLQGEGTKQVPVMRKYPDDAAVMKAETGAIGRALGVAGILVVGTGVASAEDMQEAMSAPATTAAPVGPETAALPSVPAGAVQASPDATAGTDAPPPSEASAEKTPDELDAEMRASAMQLKGELEKEAPDAWKLYVEWYTERGFPPLAELKGPALKGALQKLERDLADARAAK